MNSRFNCIEMYKKLLQLGIITSIGLIGLAVLKESLILSVVTTFLIVALSLVQFLKSKLGEEKGIYTILFSACVFASIMRYGAPAASIGSTMIFIASLMALMTTDDTRGTKVSAYILVAFHLIGMIINIKTSFVFENMSAQEIILLNLGSLIIAASCGYIVSSHHKTTLKIEKSRGRMRDQWLTSVQKSRNTLTDYIDNEMKSIKASLSNDGVSKDELLEAFSNIGIMSNILKSESTRVSNDVTLILSRYRELKMGVLKSVSRRGVSINFRLKFSSVDSQEFFNGSRDIEEAISFLRAKALEVGSGFSVELLILVDRKGDSVRYQVNSVDAEEEYEYEEVESDDSNVINLFPEYEEVELVCGCCHSKTTSENSVSLVDNGVENIFCDNCANVAIDEILKFRPHYQGLGIDLDYIKCLDDDYVSQSIKQDIISIADQNSPTGTSH